MSLLGLYFGALAEAATALTRANGDGRDDDREDRDFDFLLAAAALVDLRHALDGNVRIDASVSGLPVRGEIVQVLGDAARPPDERDPGARGRMLDDILVRRRMPTERNRMAAQRHAYCTALHELGPLLRPLRGPARAGDRLRWAWWEGSTNRPHLYDVRFGLDGPDGRERLADAADPLRRIARGHIPAFPLRSLAAKLDMAGGEAARPKALHETTLRRFRVKALFPDDPRLAQAPEDGWYVEWTRKSLVSARTVQEPHRLIFRRPREAYMIGEAGQALLKGVTEFERSIVAPHAVLTAMPPAELERARAAGPALVVLRDGSIHPY